MEGEGILFRVGGLGGGEWFFGFSVVEGGVG